MEMKAAGVRELATRLRIEIEGLRDAYWGQIDKTDNESMSAAFNVAQRLNEAVAEVDATLHSVDLAVDLIEDELVRKGAPPVLVEDVDEDIDDELDGSEEAADNVTVAAMGDSIAALDARTQDSEEGPIDETYKPRVVSYTHKRVRDGSSTLPEDQWLSLDQEFSYSKPTTIQLGPYEWDALRSWKGTYMRSLRVLARDFPDAFKELPNTRLIRHRRALFGTSGEMMNSPQRIGSLYVETNLSAANVASLLAALHSYFALEGVAQVKIRHVVRDVQ